MTDMTPTLPPLPTNLLHVLRRIRACESDVPAQVVLEHILTAYGEQCARAAVREHINKSIEGSVMFKDNIPQQANAWEACYHELRSVLGGDFPNEPTGQGSAIAAIRLLASRAATPSAVEARVPAKNLMPVIQWLEGGCDPKHAAAELRLLSAAPAAPGPQGVAEPEKWIDDPHDIEQGRILNPEWLKFHDMSAKDVATQPPTQQAGEWFVDSNDIDMERFPTQAEALAFLKNELHTYRKESNFVGEWPPEAESLVCGFITHKVVLKLMDEETGGHDGVIVSTVAAPQQASAQGEQPDIEAVLKPIFRDAMDWGRSYGSRLNLPEQDRDDVSAQFAELARKTLTAQGWQAQQASAQPTQEAKDVQPRLTVRLTSFPESNGKRNWTALLVRVDPWDGLVGNCGGITVDRGELWNRVAYEAECARFLIGERDTQPHILDYGDDMETPDKWPGETRGGWPKRLDRASNTGQEKS